MLLCPQAFHTQTHRWQPLPLILVSCCSPNETGLSAPQGTRKVWGTGSPAAMCQTEKSIPEGTGVSYNGSKALPSHLSICAKRKTINNLLCQGTGTGKVQEEPGETAHAIGWPHMHGGYLVSQISVSLSLPVSLIMADLILVKVYNTSSSHCLLSVNLNHPPTVHYWAPPAARAFLSALCSYIVEELQA